MREWRSVSPSTAGSRPACTLDLVFLSFSSPLWVVAVVESGWFSVYLCVQVGIFSIFLPKSTLTLASVPDPVEIPRIDLFWI